MPKLTGLANPAIIPESGEEPAGIYLHIPFCKSKCAYCAFDSRACTTPPSEYPAALARQIDFWAGQPWSQSRNFASLFLGGGTPTIYQGSELARLIDHCRQAFHLGPDAEISVEANPNTLDPTKLATLRWAGVNRLSIGVQAFDDRLLTTIGRSHSSAEAKGVIVAARQAGFGNLNLDLIAGLPGQSPADWRQTLEQALEFAPEHLACYELSIEESTPFAGMLDRGELQLPEEEALLAMAEDTLKLSAQAGLLRYEISNFARPGSQCRHNRNYWQNGNYLGLGAGAVSCLSGVRIKNIVEPELYLRLVQAGIPPLLEAECLPLAARFRESVVMGLRLLEGVSFDQLNRRFGLTPPSYYGKTLDTLADRGLVAFDTHRLWLTATGLPLANQALAELV